MEACAGAHYWGREICDLGHSVRLISPQYVKPYVKRQKNDAADAEAICEAASRPTMNFVAIKTAEQQARGMLSSRPRSRHLVNGVRIAGVMAAGEFLAVPIKVLWGHLVVDALMPAFEHGPERIHAVGRQG